MYGLRLDDDRAVVLKVHRPPVGISHLETTDAGLRHLSRHGYPCPDPIDGPVLIDGHVVTVQSLLTRGTAGDAHRPPVRRAMAASLAEHIEILTGIPGGTAALAPRLGPGPAWTQYTGGPWPTPHEPIFDFTGTPAGWEWLDDYAREATAELIRLHSVSPTVIAHADWYAGNLRFEDDRVVAAFDWELIADQEAVLVGLSAGGYLADAAPSPTEVADYIDDYDKARPLHTDGRRAAATAARWMLAFNARCDLSMLEDAPAPGSALHRLATDREAYRLIHP
ncbi:hypothetical protein N868_04965 [Cellulomonas carbonis T26]|uniref:Aminoglycoside phosphotransferase domain-containing protein n=1 Tax=Cellulomonas carbonis T26 TaxID=947969 RepID=A0A0A0BW28_9CELL|nr:hypothetical protein N868_04965 [Cellulomonas carbonis T26]